MKCRSFPCLLGIVIALLPFNGFGQGNTTVPQTRKQRAMDEVEIVLAKAGKLADKNAFVKVQAKAANVVWLYDASRAKRLFGDLWGWIESQEDKDFDKEMARSIALKNLSLRDAKMATRFMDELNGKQKSDELPLLTQALGNDANLKRLTQLSSDLMEQDATRAAALLQRSLAVGISPAGLVALIKLRDKNPVLADYVAAQTLETLKGRPSFIALIGMNLMIEYIFPAKQNFSESFDAPPDQALRTQFFFNALEVLKNSLNEEVAVLQKDSQYTKQTVKVRDIYQGKIAFSLAALAPEYGPERLPELSEIVAKLSKNLPADFLQNAKILQMRLSERKPEAETGLEVAASLAINKGDFDEATSLIGRIENETTRKALTQVLQNVEFRVYMSKANLAEALITARKTEDLNMQASMFAQVAKAAFRKGEIEFARLILAEARALLAKADCNGVQVRALFSLASEATGIAMGDALEFLYRGAPCISYLMRYKEAATQNTASHLRGIMAEINDPSRLIEEPELRRAFSLAGAIDFENTLQAVDAIEDKTIEMIARLAVCEGVLKKPEEGTQKGLPDEKGAKPNR
jgi:hypothetical protein